MTFSRFSITGKIRMNSISKFFAKLKTAFLYGKRFSFFVYLPNFSGARGSVSASADSDEVNSSEEREELVSS